MASPTSNRPRPGPAILFAATVAVLFVITQLTDRWIFHHFAYPAIYERGWGRLLRAAGYAPTWALGALALVLHDWVPRVPRTQSCRTSASAPSAQVGVHVFRDRKSTRLNCSHVRISYA